jgi:thiol-disulfide isomerase/thioredoxin
MRLSCIRSSIVTSIAIVSATLWSCKGPEVEKEQPEIISGLSDGFHRGVIHANDSTDIAFNFEWISESDTSLVIFNAEEKIQVSDIRFENDSLTIQMPVFLSYFRMVNTADGMTGFWYNPDKAPGYKVKTDFTRDEANRFIELEDPMYSLNKKWKVQLYAGTDKEKSVIGEFYQTGNTVSGSILTETGDYRYLDGVVSGNKLLLSTFDGAHAYAFTARVHSPGKLEGKYYSGKHFSSNWNAIRDDNFSLTKADELSQIISGDGRFEFQFRDMDGNLFNMTTHEKMQNKVVIVSIMGSWCPNCMDEVRFMNPILEKYQDQGLEMVGISFERRGEWEKDSKALLKMIEDLDIKYPILYGGATRHVKDSLPQLQPFRSFPTAIFLDRKGYVRKVHTGFSGPGTSAFASYAQETETFIQELLAE